MDRTEEVAHHSESHFRCQRRVVAFSQEHLFSGRYEFYIIPGEGEEDKYTWHENLAALEQSAIEGCDICRLFQQVVIYAFPYSVEFPSYAALLASGKPEGPLCLQTTMSISVLLHLGGFSDESLTFSCKLQGSGGVECLQVGGQNFGSDEIVDP